MGADVALDFTALVNAVRSVHEQCAAQASRAVNVSLTLRNWLIGAYVHEYELRGADRANYGERLLSELAERLEGAKVSNCNRRQLYRYLRFFRLYPEIVGTLPPPLRGLLPPPYLEGALMVALALATRKQQKTSEGDLNALSEVEARVTKEITRLERVKKLAETIRLNAEKIAKEVGQGEDQLRSIVEDAQATLTALNVELVELAVEHANPITLNVG